MRRARRVVAAITVAGATVLSGAPGAAAAECPSSGGVVVPGAEKQIQACLDDLTTAGTSRSGHTDPSDWAGLTPTGQRNPSGVPGLQVDGYMPDNSTANGTRGWNHDSQFVIRLPNDWNGRLVVTGAPGTRRQYAADPVIGDWILSKGYAYAATDKGNGGLSFYRDGSEPGDAGVEWNHRVTELTIAAKEVVRQRYGRPPERTYMTGISQGGYLTRWQLENRPELYDGGVDWEGTLWQADSPNPFTYLPVALRNHPRYRATGDRAAHDAMIAAGFAPGSEFLWEDHYAVYWDLTQRTYREEFDPQYDGPTEAGTPFCQSGTPSCDADYDYAARQGTAGAPLSRIANTGRIGKPMITLHGTLDSLLPIAVNADPYRKLVERAGRADLHRYWVIENGNHVDGRYDAYPNRIRPLWPCWTAAFDAMTRWVENGVAPPPDQFVPDERRGADVVNTCTIPQRPLVVNQPGRCLAERSPIGPRNIGRVRLGYTRRRLLRLPVEPVRRTRRSYRYCVNRSKGRVSAVLSGRGRVVLVASTSSGHGNRGVRPGQRVRALRAYPRRRSFGRNLFRFNPRSRRVVGVRRGRVRFVAVVDRRLLRSPRSLRR